MAESNARKVVINERWQTGDELPLGEVEEVVPELCIRQAIRTVT